MGRLRYKIILITGAAGGIGSAIAEAVVRNGGLAVATDIAGRTGMDHVLDVTSESDWRRVMEAVGSAGRLDGLVNAAGIVAIGTVEDTDFATWRRVMAINLDGTFLGCTAVMPHMIAEGTGAIVNIASIVSFMATPSALAYGVSKAGVEQLTRSLAIIGAADGGRVRCNSVHPGVIRTRMTDSIIQSYAANTGISEAEAEAGINSAVPFGVRGAPEDVAAMIAFLVNDDAAYVTGASFRVDGGWSVISAG